MSSVWIVLALSILVVVMSGSAIASASPGYPGIRLGTMSSVPIFISALGIQKKQTVCPRAPLWLNPAGLKQASTAIAHAMPALFQYSQQQGTPRMDGRDAVAIAGRSTTAHAGTTFKTFCSPLVWQRSAFVSVRLPRVRFSASLSYTAFEVARTRLGWIVWAQVH